MTNFYLKEMKQGRLPMPSGKDPKTVAFEKATRLARFMTGEHNDGMLMHNDGVRQSLEAPFFERTLNFSPQEIPGISQFLVNDLEGIVTRYASQLARRRVVTREFGQGNHAASTYIDVIQNGKDAIVAALTNNKEVSTIRRAADATMDTRVAETSRIVTGIRRPDGGPASKEEVSDMVDGALEMLGTSKAQWKANKEKVRNYLINLQEPEVVASQPEFLKRIDAIVNALSEYGGYPDAVPGTELNAMVDAVNSIGGRSRDVSPQLSKFSRNIRSFQQITLLPWTTLTSIPDLGLPAVRSGNIKASVAGWKLFLNDPHYREMARNIGVGTSGIMHESMANVYNDTTGKVSNAFFNANMLTPWTETMRSVASLVGLESFKAEAKKAQDFVANGMTESPGYRKAMRYLTRYGLEEYALPGAKAISENSSDIATNDKMRDAMLRFTNEALFSPNPNDIPLWAQHPVGQIIFQLKSFPLMMGRLSKYTVTEAMNGNTGPFMMLLATAGIFGSTSLAVKDIVLQRGEDGETFRRRRGTEGAMTGAFIRWYNSVAEDLGLAAADASTADAVIGWFAESFMTAGGFGLFADLLHSSVEQADNQDYGAIRTFGAVFGPSASTAFDAIKVVQAAEQQVFSEEPDTRTQRSAVRSVVGRIPFVGGIKSAREEITNAVAGEPQ